LSDYTQWHPAIFDGLEDFDIVCLDDIHCIAGTDVWELALFNLFNRLREKARRLCISAKCSPASADFNLPDLASRLSWGVSLRLADMSDEEKVQALAMRAQARGFRMSDEVAGYLLKHCPRDLHSLFAILDHLDIASLQAQRRLTLPFIKQCLQDQAV